MKRHHVCALCGERLHATPILNIVTRKGTVHVGCAVRGKPR